MTKSLALIGALLFLPGTAQATVWYVHPDSTLNSIQAGLDSCVDNDTVLVGPGIYYENLGWPNIQGINLMSEFSPDTTIIDGNNTDGVITINVNVDSTTVIKGFTVQNGYKTYGAGILCAGSPTITSNIITNNTAHWMPLIGAEGAGIYCGNGSPAIVDNTISSNYSELVGGGICCDYSSSAKITDNTIMENTAEELGGGIYCYNATPMIIDNVISNNASNVNQGGGIACFDCTDSSVHIYGNTIANNTAPGGAGIWLHNSSPVINGNTINGNTAVYQGGGVICWDQSSPIVTRNSITGNTATYGAGIYCSDFSSPRVDSCTISGNNGDGFYCEDFLGGAPSYPIIHYCNITNNSGYGVRNVDSFVVIDATYNWWGHSSGPGGAGPGTGDEVSNYVDYTPWLANPVGVEQQPIVNDFQKYCNLGATIISGPLYLPEGKKCRVFDITGRVVEPTKITRGVYFVEIDNKIVQKVIKIR